MSRTQVFDLKDVQAQEALKRLYGESARSAKKTGRPSAHSWAVVARKLEKNAGYVYRVAMGQKRASNSILISLGIAPRQALAPACVKCGVVHVTKKCTANHKPRPRAYRYIEYPVFTLGDLTDLAVAQPDARVVVLGVGAEWESVRVGWRR